MKTQLALLISLLLNCTASIAAAERAPLGKDYPFVGFGTLNGSSPHCTYTIVKHGRLLTAKHCFEHRVLAGQPVKIRSLEVRFPGGTVIRGEQMNDLINDSGDNDLAWVTYSPSATSKSIALPKIEYANELPGGNSNLEMPGSPGMIEPRPFINVVACKTTGRQGYFSALPKDPGYHGLLIEIDCPAWYGQSGSPVFEKVPDGSLLLHGVLSHTFNVTADGSLRQDKIESDRYGQFIREAMFSPMNLRVLER